MQDNPPDSNEGNTTTNENHFCMLCTMMLAITRARQIANPAECDGDADRGSDLGDDSDPETVLSDFDAEDCTDSEIDHALARTNNLDDDLTWDPSL